MGWEYHNRRRKIDGTFNGPGKRDKIWIRCRNEDKELIRGAAMAAGMDITEFILTTMRRTIAEGAGAAVKGSGGGRYPGTIPIRPAADDYKIRRAAGNFYFP